MVKDNISEEVAIDMRRSQRAENKDIPDRGNFTCKGPKMGQTVVSSGNKMKAVLKVDF